MATRFLSICKKPCGFDNDVYTEIAPRNSGRSLFYGKAFDFMPIDNEGIVIRDIMCRFFAIDFTLEASLGAVVFYKVGKVVCGYKVIDSDDVDRFAE